MCSKNREPKNKTWRWQWQATSLQFEGFDVDLNPALTFGLQPAIPGHGRRQQALQIEMEFALPKQGVNGVCRELWRHGNGTKTFGAYLTPAHGQNLVFKQLEEAKTLAACRIFASLSMIYSN